MARITTKNAARRDTGSSLAAFAASLSACLLFQCIGFFGTAHAVVLWSLTIEEENGGDIYPTIVMSNLSTAGETIQIFSISIGDTAYYFDAAFGPQGTVETGANLDIGDTNIWDSSGTDVIQYSFGDFDPGETFSFRVDIDPGWNADVLDTLINNGAADQSEVNIEFYDPVADDVILGDYVWTKTSTSPASWSSFRFRSPAPARSWDSGWSASRSPDAGTAKRAHATRSPRRRVNS
jgi:hypothetical protein